jgi:hypothetical protein
MNKYLPPLSFILLLVLLVGPGACAKRSKNLAVPAECPQMIQQAKELYDARHAQLDAVQRTRVANLIEASRIDQEHGDYTACMDKASRAMVLANQPGGTGK